jgi:hypothetical protein
MPAADRRNGRHTIGGLFAVSQPAADSFTQARNIPRSRGSGDRRIRRRARQRPVQRFCRCGRVTRRVWIVLLYGATMTGTLATATPVSDPVQLLLATGLIDQHERSRLETGNAVVAVLPAGGRDLAVFGVTRTTGSGDRLAAGTRAIERLYPGRYVTAIGRFSEPPQLADVGGLVLDDQDLNDLRKCRPGDCGLKLSAAETLDIRAAASAAGAAWKPAVQLAFRRVIVARARAYRERGLAGAPPYADRKDPVSPAVEFSEIAAQIGFQPIYGSLTLTHLESCQRQPIEVAQAFLYWSKESLGAGKPIVSITHVAIVPNPSAHPTSTVVAARQVYASHYLTGSLSLTVITNRPDGTPAYLVYLRRLRTDAFDGVFGGVIRHIVEGRIRSDAPALLEALRRNLEAGDAPPR